MSHILLRKSPVVQQQLRKHPKFFVGSIVNVHYTIKEGGKERIQVFSGVVTKIHGTKNTDNSQNLNATFTVLKTSTDGVKVTRVFFLHYPGIVKIEVVKLQRARRSNLRNLIETKDPLKSVRAKSVKVTS